MATVVALLFLNFVDEHFKGPLHKSDGGYAFAHHQVIQ